MSINSEKMKIAISSRALFDLEDSHRVFQEKGVDAYCQYQIEHENEPLEPGVAYPLVKKLLALNEFLTDSTKVEVVLISRNSADTGLRVFNSINHFNLDISRAAFSGGESPYRYIQPFETNLFLSADPLDVASALELGIAAATILPSRTGEIVHDQLRIAFDGDAVLFSDEAERVFRERGLEEFSNQERQSARTPLLGGPFKKVLSALHRLQVEFPSDNPPIRTALVTARAAPAHERVIRTLRAWNIRIDEAVFLGGLPKGKFLETFGADIFFDDQRGHCDSSREHVPTGHVPHGIANG